MKTESYPVTTPPVHQVELEVRPIQEVHKVKASATRKSVRSCKPSQKVKASLVGELSMEESHVAESSLIKQLDGTTEDSESYPVTTPPIQQPYLPALIPPFPKIIFRGECQICGEKSVTFCSDCKGMSYCG